MFYPDRLLNYVDFLARGQSSSDTSPTSRLGDDSGQNRVYHAQLVDLTSGGPLTEGSKAGVSPAGVPILAFDAPSGRHALRFVPRYTAALGRIADHAKHHKKTA
jgi:hypothetical protein